MRTKIFAILSCMIVFSIACSLTRKAEPTQPIPTPVDTENQSSEKLDISVAQGGSLNLGNEVEVKIPAHALSSDQTVSITKLPEKPTGDEENIIIAGDVYEIRAEQDIFEAPISIVIKYDESLLPEGRSEGEIFGVFLYEGKWHRMLGEVDKEKNLLTLNTIHASDWSWGFEKLTDLLLAPYATAMNCVQNIKDPMEVPKNLTEAYNLRDRRLQEWKDAINASNITVTELDENLKKRLKELGIDVARDVEGEIVLHTEMLVAELLGVKGHDAVLAVGGTIAGIYSLVDASIKSLDTSTHSGEVFAEMVKIKAAQQRYMAAKAYVYLFENPDAKTVPPEYMVALLATCSEIPDRAEVSGDIVSWWTADGNANDTVGENHGQLVNGASYAHGVSGQAFNFDGIDDYVLVSNPQGLPIGNSERTICFWMLARELLPDDYQVMLVYGEVALTHLSGLGMDKINQRLYVGQYGQAICGNPPPEGTWVHVAATYDGSTYRLFENGQNTVSGSMTTDTQKGDLLIGTQLGYFSHRCGLNGTCPFNGLIDDVMIFRRALSDEEIREIYENR